MPRFVAERADVLPALAEVFREHGFAGASLALIGERTGLGKGSLYHFFPGGKAEMAAAVLAEIGQWFEAKIFQPLRETADPRRAIAAMIHAVDDYFHSGRRVCLVGALALGDARDHFARAIRKYFASWIAALGDALARAGHKPRNANTLAEEAVLEVQGALVLARALNDPAVFARTLARLRNKLALRAPGRRRAPRT